MGKNKKPKTSSKPQNPLKVEESKISTNLVVSYEYLDLNNKKYSMDTISDSREKLDYYNDYYEKMKEYCKFENFKKDIKGRYSKINHIHPIDWSDNRIRETSFTSLDNNLMEQVKNDCWQLGINNHGFRVHGFFVDNVFYIVWLDPSHELYERK